MILHYDIMRTFEMLISDYTQDPALPALAKADEVTAAMLRPSAERLAHQIGQKRQPGRVSGTPKSLERRIRALARPGRTAVYVPEEDGERHARLGGSIYGPISSNTGTTAGNVLCFNAGSKLKSPIIFVGSVHATGEAAPSFRIRRQ